MKKFLILILSFLFIASNAYSGSYTDGLNKVNDVLNTIDRTEYTVNRVKRRADDANNAVNQVKQNNQRQRNTQIYQNNSSKRNNSYQNNSSNTNYQNQNRQQYYNVDTDIPEYPQEQEQTINEGNYNYAQNKIFTGTVNTLDELPAGTIVMDPKSVWKFRWWDNYSGRITAEHPVFWRKLEDNHYKEGTTLLLSEVVVAKYPFCHSQKGLRDWAESDVRRFLRTTFYTHLSEGFKNAIVNVSVPYADMNGNPKTIEDNFFLLSIVEWGLSDRANNGTVIKYDNLPEIYEAKDFSFHEPWNAFTMYGAGRGIATRTINRPEAKSAGYINDVFEVLSDGVLSTAGSSSNLAWVRPAVNLKSSTKVKGPYKFRYSINKQETLIYYVLEF